MLRRPRPLLDEDDAVRAGVAAIWAAGGWPTAAKLAHALRQAEDSYPQRLTGVRWSAGNHELPRPLATALDRLVRSGELDVVEDPDGADARLRPSRALVEDWLPLVKGRELRQLDEPKDAAARPASVCVAAAVGAVRGPVPKGARDDDALVAEELRLRAQRFRLLAERRRDAVSRFWDLHEEAALLAQTGQPVLARRRWSELGNARLDPFDGPHEWGALGLLALEEAVLAGDQHLRDRVLSLPVSEEGLTRPGAAWQRALRGLVLDDATAVEQGAVELDRLDQRTRKETADVALGAAARALLADDREAFRAALGRTLEQYLRYLRSGSWRGEASPVRAGMVLRVLGCERGIRLPDALFEHRVTVTLRCCDEWQGEPVHRHRGRGTVSLAPVPEV